MRRGRRDARRSIAASCTTSTRSWWQSSATALCEVPYNMELPPFLRCGKRAVSRAVRWTQNMADQSADAAADDERVEERRSSPLKSPRVRLALLVGAIAIVAAGLLWYFDRETRGKYMQSTDNAYVSADSVVVA